MDEPHISRISLAWTRTEGDADGARVPRNPAGRLRCRPLLLGTGKLDKPLALNSTDRRHLTHYGSAWIGGVLGGSVFSIKWLYHSIARGKWHLDRRPWRFLTPLMSGARLFFGRFDARSIALTTHAGSRAHGRGGRTARPPLVR
jgi:hypothetical protein